MSHDLQGRRFQVWDFSPSFKRLLLRSPKSEKKSFNIDVIFYGVSYMDIASSLGEISINEQVQGGKYTRFIIQSEYGIYKVDASQYLIDKSEMDFFDSPLDQI